MLDVTMAQADLEGLLKAVASAVSTRPHLPVLASALLEAQEGGSELSCVGYDLSLGVRALAPACVASGGVVAVPHRMLAALVTRMPDGEAVRLRLTDDDQLVVEAGGGRYGITVAADAADYPSLPVVAADPVSAPYRPLRIALATVAHAASQVESKPELAGVHFALSGGELRLEAIDGSGHRAVFVRVPDLLTDGAGDGEFTLPINAVRELQRLDLGDDDLLELGCDGGVAVFRAGRTTLISNLVAGTWPPLASKLPSKYKVSLIVNREDMLAAVGRAQVVADLTECVVALDITPGSITVSSENDLARAADRVALEDGSTDVVDRQLFRSKYLMDALKHTEGSLVSINYVKSGTLSIFEPVGSTLQRYLVMGLAPKPA